MATFKLGQRVRAKSSGLVGDPLVGREGTFLRYEDKPAGSYGYNPLGYYGPCIEGCNCVVKYDGVNKEMHDHTDYIEPIQPERNQIVAWNECPFTKEGKWVGGEVTA